MIELFPPAHDEQIAEINREIAMRESVYPRRPLYVRGDQPFVAFP